MASAKKLYPYDEEDKAMEEEIVKAIKELPSLPTKIKALVLNTYLQEEKQINLDLEAELAVVSAKYKNLAKPLVEKANAIISGTVPAEDELKGLNDYATAEEQQKKDEAFANIKPLDDYWLTVLKNSAIMKTFIQERDFDALKTLKSINYSASTDSAKPHDFTVTFTFGPNEFFETEVLTKTYHMKEEKECEKAVGCEIKWKEGKNLTKKTVTKKQKNKKTGKTRTVTKEVDTESFFSFFKTVEAKEHDHKEDEDDEENDEAHQAQEELLDHFDFGSTFIDEILPYHLEYYLNVKKDIDFGGLGGEGDEDDDDNDDDDDEEEEKPKKGKGKKPTPKADTGAPAGKQQCNQQ